MKGRKKQFPPGTFIPTPARVVAIIQLCLAFTAILWSCGYPFMGELFELKSEMLIYRYVLGTPLGGFTAAPQETLEEQRAFFKRNQNRFQLLPEWQKEQISAQYQNLQNRSEISFFSKLRRGLHLIFFEVPPFEQAWMLFSVVIPIMLLIRMEGAVSAAWILPVLVFFYALANQVEGKTSFRGEVALFPSEENIVSEYLKKPLSSNILEQQRELMHGWQLYLIKVWAKSLPSNDSEMFKRQVEQGEFAFNVARTEVVAKHPHPSPFQLKQPLILLFLYFAWNLFFAAYIQMKMSPSSSQRAILEGA